MELSKRERKSIERIVGGRGVLRKARLYVDVIVEDANSQLSGVEQEQPASQEARNPKRLVEETTRKVAGGD